jgi:hypothetical protein
MTSTDAGNNFMTTFFKQYILKKIKCARPKHRTIARRIQKQKYQKLYEETMSHL